MYKKIFFTLAFCTLIPFSSVEAVGNLQSAAKNLAPAKQAAGYGDEDIGDITGQIINTALSLVGIIFLALMVYAGYLWMTAQGEDTQIEKSKKILTSAIIGLVITLSAYAITALVTKKFGGEPGASGAGGRQNGGPEMIVTPCNQCIDACAGRQDENACLGLCNAGVCRRP